MVERTHAQRRTHGVRRSGRRLAPFDDEHVVAADAGWAADPASTTPRTSRRFALAAVRRVLPRVHGPRRRLRSAACAEGRARPERRVPADPRERRRRGRGPLEGEAGRGRGIRRARRFERAVDPSEYAAALAHWARFQGVATRRDHDRRLTAARPQHGERAAPHRGTARPSERRRLLLERGLQLEGDRHLVAEQHAAGLERRVVGEAEVLAVDDGLRRRAALVVAVGVAAEAAEVEVEGDAAW